MREYEQLGHMIQSAKVKSSNNELPIFYLPHHAVIKDTSLTTKLRVVFDGSAKSSSNVSLNDALINGPVLQEDLLSIILRFRTHQYVMSADIGKMYRQVLVDESHTQLQRIVWRNNKNEEVKSYNLTTATYTYGTTSASFLAIRTLHQLANEERINFPIGSAITLRDFYVDDLLTGANSIKEAEIIHNEVQAMLLKGGFEIRKWISNCPALFKKFNDNSVEHITVNLDKDQSIKTLGLQWNSHKDTLQYSIPNYTDHKKVTKRIILSQISQIFDPLGLLGPVIVMLKLLMQNLWKLNLAWDESVPIEIHSRWCEYKNQLQYLNIISVPRWIVNSNAPWRREFHGFCDASELAYGACIYMRTSDEHAHSSHLIFSKSKVSPLKSISLAKLELCGALLLARLINSMKIPLDDIHYGSDSTIALTWITSTARTWKTFVANRVSEIQDLSKQSEWYHVGTHDNPADVISRGLLPANLNESKLWWHGPQWLCTDNSNWPKSSSFTKDGDVPEKRSIVSNSAITSTFDNDLFCKFSNFKKLMRLVAYCLRFKNNALSKKNHSEKQDGPLSVKELTNATTIIIKKLQQNHFPNDINNLKSKKPIHAKSVLICLNPFLDSDGLLRVGGRLNNSLLPYEQKHPILLPKGNFVTRLIIEGMHRRELHAGVEGTLAAVRTIYWPLNARNTVKQVIRNCIICFKTKPVAPHTMMGNLPANRITPSRPFTHCGVDYFGPLHVRDHKRRNSKTVKTYGAMFVCFATKAVHLELVSDLTSEAFINGLRRFMARRGKPSHIHSDNGTNFVGTNNELKQLSSLFLSTSGRNNIISSMTNEGINWHFIPPRSPHFGGLWEAAVKSAKHHIRRVAMNAAMTFEEMYTLLTQIEAILNSRPLCPLSHDPTDLAFLTPGHFLIGDALTSTNDPDLTLIKINRLSRWQHVCQLRQHFWQRWSKEYLHNLQQRTKWKSSTSKTLCSG